MSYSRLGFYPTRRTCETQQTKVVQRPNQNEELLGSNADTGSSSKYFETLHRLPCNQDPTHVRTLVGEPPFSIEVCDASTD